MRKKILCGLIRIVCFFLQGVYGLLKLLPVKNRVCFFSRQSDRIPLDFALLQKELQTAAPGMEQVCICHRYRDSRDGTARFALDQLRSIYLLATSRVCVLDAYWPAVSLLNHRPELTVIQLWHSMGKIKRSGYQTLGMPSGRDAQLAKALRMHRNYDYIITGGTAWEQFYCEAFNTTAEKLCSYGLPRLDWLLKRTSARAELEKKYPELRGKTIVLYAPTYRKYPISAPEELKKAFDGSEYALICRLHPNQKLGNERDMKMDRYGKEEIFALLTACDYLVTDYSSLAIEGAALKKKTLYYLFDHDRYMRENGLNIDPAEIMPNCTYETAEGIFQAVHKKSYPMCDLLRYRSKYLPKELGQSTQNIVSLMTGVPDEEKCREAELV